MVVDEGGEGGNMKKRKVHMHMHMHASSAERAAPHASYQQSRQLRRQPMQCAVQRHSADGAASSLACDACCVRAQVMSRRDSDNHQVQCVPLPLPGRPAGSWLAGWLAGIAAWQRSSARARAHLDPRGLVPLLHPLRKVKLAQQRLFHLAAVQYNTVQYSAVQHGTAAGSARQ